MSAPFVLDRPDVIHRAVRAVLCGIFPTISPDALLGAGRVNHTTAWVRQVGMYLMADRLQMTQIRTAALWKRDRTTVLHAVQLCRDEAQDRPATAAFFDFLESQVLAALTDFVANEDATGVPFHD